jgi:hypothetical protein
MKLLTNLLFLCVISHCNAQIKIDTNYILIAKGVEYKSGAFIGWTGNLDSLMIKEISSGKTCMLASAEWTFIIKSEIFHDHKPFDVKTHLGILQPKDKIFIEKIVLPADCFRPPKQIAITVT